MALPSAQRLSRTADFTSVRESGRSWTGRHLIVAVRPRPDRGHAHFGFTTTRRIGNAVKRNLVRRRLRMIVREFAPRIGLTHDVVTIARHSAVRADYEAVRQDWVRLATRAGLLIGGGREETATPLPPLPGTPPPA
ncbi:MAG: ribonuclease P protein component [Verrucomicrobiota bacterium]